MVTFEHVTKTYKGGTQAVRDLNLTIEKGRFVVLIGPSGCGKTTTLKMVNRLIEPTSGEIYLEGRKTSTLNLVQMRRNIGYVIQHIGLLPHLTVAANIALVPELKGWPRKKREERVDELLAMVGMDPAVYRNRFPAQLSGGQQQRIGVLRALAADPELILMDEPFGALDPLTREQLQLEFKRLKERLKKTIIFVTHDMNEALLLADRIILMKDGVVVQDDTPEGLLRHPANDFVASFVGRAAQPQAAADLLVRDVMNPAPVTIEAERGLGEALKRMQKYKVDSLLVLSDGRLMGLVQARDLYPYLLKDETVPVAQVAVQAAVTVSPDLPLSQAAEKLTAGGAYLVPVVGDDGRLLGVLTRASLVGVLLDAWNGGSGSTEEKKAAAGGGGAK
ncbi:ABC transporter ATP-binding protein [Gelria sp. Kuro-4]|uniref:betaine/proline/choline family ABC transporter ATP-binding protein n=1 Tax=Gelria sp. Kuro-4 TaxID=2796927 RepID=UPI001BEF511C|nr:ABC transporter ATP-binding protein [Gelria sp. Kuro-4]BCV24449.1 glycine/betaine ABC transporter ATPase [Gelria sp. Kuro-4]